MQCLGVKRGLCLVLCVGHHPPYFCKDNLLHNAVFGFSGLSHDAASGVDAGWNI
jgi:hypothetical protein